jgi:hypothetical protein
VLVGEGKSEIVAVLEAPSEDETPGPVRLTMEYTAVAVAPPHISVVFPLHCRLQEPKGAGLALVPRVLPQTH